MQLFDVGQTRTLWHIPSSVLHVKCMVYARRKHSTSNRTNREWTTKKTNTQIVWKRIQRTQYNIGIQVRMHYITRCVCFFSCPFRLRIIYYFIRILSMPCHSLSPVYTPSSDDRLISIWTKAKHTQASDRKAACVDLVELETNERHLINHFITGSNMSTFFAVQLWTESREAQLLQCLCHCSRAHYK